MSAESISMRLIIITLERPTQRMAATQLRLLRILASQLVSDAIQQLNIALLRVLLQCGDKSPRHCARSLSAN